MTRALPARRWWAPLALGLALASAQAQAQAPAQAAEPAAMRCGPPAERADGWPVAPPGQRAFDPAVFCQTITRRWAGANLHGILVEQRGVLQFEAYFDGRDNPGASLFSREVSFTADDLHDLRSVTKSVVGLLTGIALDRGLLKGGLDQPVLDWFPEHADLATPERRRITLAHLLTMTVGLAWDESGSYLRPDNSETRMRFALDPVRHVLERDIVAEPGSRFVYNSGATLLLGEVITRATGRPLDVVARDWLFAPLGIERTEWRRARDQVTPFGGLRLRPRDLARIGRMLLDGGQWQGRQLVPATWIDASFQPRVPTGSGELRYGYQWWRGAFTLGPRRVGWVAAMGNGGQRMFLLPELDLVVVVTAGNYNQPDSWRAPMQVFGSVAAEVGKREGAAGARVRVDP